MFMFRPSQRDNSQTGFSLVEILVVSTIMVILATISFKVFTNNKTKAQESQIPIRLAEVAFAVESYKQLRGGKLTGLTSYNLLPEGYDASASTIMVCPDWSNGAASPGKYTLYGKVPNGVGTQWFQLGSNIGDAAKSVGTTQPSDLCASPIQPSIIPPNSLTWTPNQTVTVSNDNGWKRGDTVQTTSSPGIVVADVPVTPNTNYTYSIDAYKTAPGAAFLYVGTTSWSTIIFAGTIPTTSSRVSTTFNSGANTTVRLAVLWNPPGGAGSSMWLKDPALTIS